MGKGTDKLYITHSEWASEDAYSASAGAGAAHARKGGTVPGATFRRLPFNYCALSLQPFNHPVCTPDGSAIFDLVHILPYLKEHGNVNPVTGTPLKPSELVKLHFAKNEAGEYVDPVTYKVLTNNTHIVAIKTSGNVFAWDTVEKLNVKPKMWRDLVSDAEFGRKDLITLQDPLNVEGRDLSGFKHLQDGKGVPREEGGEINAGALGNAAKILRAKEAVAKARAEREAQKDSAVIPSRSSTATTTATTPRLANQSKSTGASALPYNAARYTTGKAAASFTSTGLTPHTSADLALLTDEQYMLRRGRVKIKGYAQLRTTLGSLTLELHTEYAPQAVWNFLQLARRGYYDGVSFHRNIRGFMIQGGDPTGTGRGGDSCWGKGKVFDDEVDNPLKHDGRGTVSMANKGKHTNSSQFFIAYRALPHLDRKHTIFGRLLGEEGGLGEAGAESMRTLDSMEMAPVDEGSRPVQPIKILGVKVFVDPFEEFLQEKQGREGKGKQEEVTPVDVEEAKKKAEDETTTWTGKRLRTGTAMPAPSTGGGGGRPGVGKYLQAAASTTPQEEEQGDVDAYELERAKKKLKARAGGGFGNFDSW